MKPTTKDAGAIVVSELTIHNRLPQRDPQRLALESALRGALAGFTGRWDVTLELSGALMIAVVAPDGSGWRMSCCDPEHRDPESIAETVKAACGRRRWLHPTSEPDGRARAVQGPDVDRA